VPVVEDAAHAAGSVGQDGRTGALGTIGTFSFHPSKSLGGLGAGGAITTDDAGLAERVRVLRCDGLRDEVRYEAIGHSQRLDEIQAAALRVMLPSLEGWAERRHAAGAMYADAGLGALVSLPVATEGSRPAWHLYIVRHPRAEFLAEGLRSRGVECRGYYRIPVHRQPAMQRYGSFELPATDEAAATHLAVPMHAALTREMVAEVVEAVAQSAFAGVGAGA
jgi:dTDP-4-amino-4,6-dideoxygalactose transaminase